MPNTHQLRMEDMSEAYLRALCAANGYTIDKREHDNDGVDVGLVCSDKVADDSVLESTELKIQLKSSYANITAHEDGSMIQYWVDKTQYEFGYGPYICPATGELLDRDGLDGAHVEIVDYPNMGLFITPVKKGFNRSHKRTSFFVKPEYLVIAPEEK